MTLRALVAIAVSGILFAGCASHAAPSLPTTTSSSSSDAIRTAAVSSSGAAESTLYEFPYASHGCFPNAPFFVGDNDGHIVGSARCGGTGYDGVIYVLTPTTSGYSENVVFRFPVSGPLGDQPGPIIRDSTGNVVGVSSAGIFEITHTGSGWQGSLLQACAPTKEFLNLNGAVSENGTTLYAACGQGIYRLDQSGSRYTSTLLYTFAGSAGTPQNNLVVLRSGAIFGTTYEGGANDIGSVFKLTRTASGYNLRVLHSFEPPSESTDGNTPGPGVFMDASGTLYGTTSSGGADGLGTLYKMTPNPAGVQGYKYSINFAACSTPCGESPSETYPTGRPFVDSLGNVYFTTFGSSPSYGGVFELEYSGGAYFPKTIHEFQQTDGAFPIGLFADASGTLYGAVQWGGHCIMGSSPGCGGI